MTQKKKDLLLKDLCSRLPYKPRVRYYYHSIGSAAINGYSDEGYLSYQNLEDFSLYPKNGLEKTRVYNISPYLRPMSSMTEEEKKELGNYLSTEIFLSIDGLHSVLRAQRDTSNFLYSRHLDVLGLIEKGLALEAPEGMYKN